MDLQDFVAEARLWNRDPGPQSNALVKKLRAESPETILDLYEQLIQRGAVLFQAAFGPQRTCLLLGLANEMNCAKPQRRLTKIGTPAMSVSAYLGWKDRWVDPSVIVNVHSIPKGAYV